MKNREVCKDFIYSCDESKTKHLFIENKKDGRCILFSYGYHFPMAIKLLDDSIIINTDGYSHTTACHKSYFATELGFNSFKELEKSKDNKFLFLTTSKMQKVLELGFKSKAEILEQEI